MLLRELITICDFRNDNIKQDFLSYINNYYHSDNTITLDLEIPSKDCISIINNTVVPNKNSVISQINEYTKYNKTDDIISDFNFIIRMDNSGFLSITDLELYNHNISSGRLNSRKMFFFNNLTSTENSFPVYKFLLENNIIKCSFVFFNKHLKIKIHKLLINSNLIHVYKDNSSEDYFIHPYLWIMACVTSQPIIYQDIITRTLKSHVIFVRKTDVKPDVINNSSSRKRDAWRYFYPNGGGNSKSGFVLHHKNFLLRRLDPNRYNNWLPEDLVMISKQSHGQVHRKLDYDSVYICSKNNIDLYKKCYERYLEITSSNSDIKDPTTLDLDTISPFSKYSIEVSNSFANNSASNKGGSL